MSFGSRLKNLFSNPVLDKVSAGQPETINQEVLVALGKKYLEKYPTQSSFHNQQDKARELIEFGEEDVVKSSVKCWDKLLSVFTELPNVNGWLAENIVGILNKGFGKDIQRFTPAVTTMVERSPHEVAKEFRAIISKHPAIELAGVALASSKSGFSTSTPALQAMTHPSGPVSESTSTCVIS